MSSDAVVDAANSRLEHLYAQADTLLANLSAARTAQVAAETKATVHRTRLVQLGRQAQFARSALEQSTIDSYIGGGGPLGEMAAALESLTSPSLNLSASSLATVNYLIKSRAQLINQAKSMQSAEVTMSTRATAAIAGATSATNTAARAKSAMDAVIARQQTARTGSGPPRPSRSAGLPGCRAAHHLAEFGESFGQDGRQTTRASSWRPELHAPDGATARRTTPAAGGHQVHDASFMPLRTRACVALQPCRSTR